VSVSVSGRADEGVVDVVVVGGGAAGVAAARAAVGAGARRVVLVAAGAGATEMTAGWIAATGAGVDFSALAWLPEVGLRAPGAHAFVAPSGAVVTAVSGLGTLLDLAELPDGETLGVVDLLAGAAWSAELIARSLTATLGRACVVVPVPTAGPAPGGPTALLCARALESPGITEGLGVGLRERARGCCALLFPPVLGFARDDVAKRLADAAGVPVGETGGGPGDPTALRLGRALARGVPGAVERVQGSARLSAAGEGAALVRVGATTLRASAVVLATGGLAGGGLRFERGLREPCADAPVWLAREDAPDEAPRDALPVPSSERGADPFPLFAPDAAGRARVMGAGVRVLADGRIAGPDGRSALHPWLFAAGAVISGGRGAAGHALADVLSAGASAGARAARHALGEPAQDVAARPLRAAVSGG
jgi:anaerobic glycerol-3-phosphate dehydrogenase